MLKDLRRMGGFGLLAAAMFGAVAYVAPQELGVALWKMTLVSTAAFVGYWLDRHLFPYARPHEGTLGERGQRQLRRVIIVSATMVATALAL